MRIPAYEKKIKRELRVNQFNNCLQITMAMTVHSAVPEYLSLPHVLSSVLPSFLSSLSPSSFTLSCAPPSIYVTTLVLIFLSTFPKCFPIRDFIRTAYFSVSSSVLINLDFPNFQSFKKICVKILVVDKTFLSKIRGQTIWLTAV